VEGEEVRKGPAPDRRLPVEPLLRHARRAALLGAGVWDEPNDGLGKWLCCTNSQLCRWAREGIPMMSADRLATELGMHVLNIWPDAYDDTEIEGAPMWVIDMEEAA
jgi:hypothetical protein